MTWFSVCIPTLPPSSLSLRRQRQKPFFWRCVPLYTEASFSLFISRMFRSSVTKRAYPPLVFHLRNRCSFRLHSVNGPGFVSQEGCCFCAWLQFCGTRPRPEKARQNYALQLTCHVLYVKRRLWAPAVARQQWPVFQPPWRC